MLTFDGAFFRFDTHGGLHTLALKWLDYRVTPVDGHGKGRPARPFSFHGRVRGLPTDSGDRT
jgi:hypothetical protein